VLLRGRPRWVLVASITDGARRRRLLLEPTSILVNRRARRAKTDRLDAEGMEVSSHQAVDRRTLM
jgi:hypothetical protein